MFELLGSKKPEALKGCILTCVDELPSADEHTIRLRLSLDGRDVVIYLKNLRSSSPCFFKSRFFKVSHHRETPVRSREDIGRLRLLMKMVDRSVESLNAK